MRLLIARCQVDYAGRLSAHLPMATRLILVKADGSVSVHADDRAYKPLNWMSPPCAITVAAAGAEDAGELGIAEDLVEVWHVVNRAGEELRIAISEVVADVTHELGEDPGLVKDGVEAHLQELLALHVTELGEGFQLVRREYPTPIGPVDLMCIDTHGYVAVEVKRVGTIDAVEQLTRYLEYIRAEHGMEACRGILVAESIKPQARTLARSRDMDSLELNLAELRGLKEPDLKLFG